jgi:transposase InsO family protein
VRSSKKKNSYVMVITDAFTKSATAVALPGKKAMHVAPALLAHFYTFGIPQQLVRDQGREYCNELEKLMWRALKIRHDVTTPYHSAWNSAVETFNKTLKHYNGEAVCQLAQEETTPHSSLTTVSRTFNMAQRMATGRYDAGSFLAFPPPLYTG